MIAKSQRIRHTGFTLIELLVTLAVIGILIALLLPAIQYARQIAVRLECANLVRQLAIASHLFHDAHRVLPPGHVKKQPGAIRPYSTWITALLPYLEQSQLDSQIDLAYGTDAFPFHNPPHALLAQSLLAVHCPADPNSRSSQTTRNNRLVGLTDYLGVSGTDLFARDGVLFVDSQLTVSAITDGTSNTLLIGERPPSPDSFYGWWYAGNGQLGTGSVNHLLGVREKNLFTDPYGSCFSGPYHFAVGADDQPCDRFHFWSYHSGGANFAFCDGSVRFMGYASDGILPALSTRGGNETANVP